MRALIDSRPHVPQTCTWELTLRCNLACRHCGSRAGRPRPGEMDRQTALRVVRDLHGAGCRRLTLSGGEPTLSPNLQAVAAEGARLGLRVNAIVNGTRHGRDFVRWARDAGMAGIAVGLDGTETQHDWLRGMPGLFGKALGVLDDCAAVGLPVGVVTTLWRGSWRALDEMEELLAGKVALWQLQLGLGMGNLRRSDQVAPTDLLELVPAIARLVARRRVAIHVADSIGYYGPHEATLRAARPRPLPCWAGCFAGCQHVGIEADGTVKGCLSLQATSEGEGNLQRESFADIWNRPGAFAYNRAFTMDSLAGFCRTCEHAEVCRGGCRAMLTCEGGENPYCYHRVASLAARRRRRRYVSTVVAPAALMAALGLGACDSGDPPVDAPGFCCDAYGVSLDAPPVVVDAYGVTVDAPGWAVDAYGSSVDGS